MNMYIIQIIIIINLVTFLQSKEFNAMKISFLTDQNFAVIVFAPPTGHLATLMFYLQNL